MSTADSKRIFAAIEIPDSVRSPVAAQIGAMRDADKDRIVRWERPEKMHITLKFIAEADEATVLTLQQVLSDVAGRHLPIAAEISGMGVFPDSTKPRVLWFGLGNGEAEVKALGAEIETLCGENGLSQERREYHPHLTAGRIRDARRARPLLQQFVDTGFGPASFVVNRLVLIESKLLRSGSEYSIFSHHPLADALTSEPDTSRQPQ